MSKIEIERKYLVKSLPRIKEDDIYQIEQFYFRNPQGIWERGRTYHSDKTGDMYIHTIKKSISKGVNMEDEYEMTKEDFEKFRLKCMEPGIESRHISKERWIYKQGELKWEVDKFNSGYHLIIAEIELPTKKYNLVIPSFIEEVLLLEVTGLKQFSNRNLSLKIEK